MARSLSTRGRSFINGACSLLPIRIRQHARRVSSEIGEKIWLCFDGLGQATHCPSITDTLASCIPAIGRVFRQLTLFQYYNAALYCNHMFGSRPNLSEMKHISDQQSTLTRLYTLQYKLAHLQCLCANSAPKLLKIVLKLKEWKVPQYRLIKKLQPNEERF